MSASKEIASIFKPLLIICQIFSLHCVPINKPTNSCLRHLYVLVFLFISLPSYYYFQISTTLPNVHVIIEMADLITNYTSVMLMMICITSNYVNRHVIVNSLKTLLQIANILETHLNAQLPLRSIRAFVYGQVLFMVVIWSIFSVYYIQILCPDTSKFTCSMFVLSNNIPRIVTYLHSIELCAMYYLIKIYYVILNRTFESSNESIAHVRVLYSHVSECATTLNDAYAIPLLCGFGYSFIVIFCTIYNCLFGFLLQGEIRKPGDFKYTLIPYLVLIVFFVKVLTITLLCEDISRESRKMGAIIYKVSLITNDRTLKREIQDFSLQLLHTYFTISAFGFFNIDCSLLQAIIGAVTTYLIILIQFDLAIPG